MKKKDSMDKVYIAQFGTYDLPSLGDTMFPRIFSLEMHERFGDSIVIDLYSPCGTTHPDNDLPVIHAIDELKINHNKHPYTLFVIGGGEFVHFSPVDYISVDDERKIYGVGELWEKPQKIAEEIGIPVVWNCLGVSRDIIDSNEALRIFNCCKNIPYISVRDDYSASRLNFVIDNASIHTVADMLWLFNKHFSQKNLDECFINLQREYGFLEDKYIIMQYGTSRQYDQIAEVVERFAKRKKIKVLAFVVNYCHEDLSVVEKMKELFSDFNFINKKLKPLEILSVISHACFFIGTSLHGNVAAMSYGVGNICLDMYPQFVSKMDGLFKMMGMPERIAYSPEGLEEKLSLFYENNSQDEVIKNNIDIIQDRLSKHFDKIADMIQNPAKKVGVLSLNRVQGAVWAKCIIKTSSEENIYPIRIENGHVEIKSDMRYEGTANISLYIDGIFAVRQIICKADNRPIQMESVSGDFEREDLQYFERVCSFELRVPNGTCEKLIVDIQIVMGEHIIRNYQEMYIDKLKNENYEQACELKRKQGHLEYMLNQERGLLSELEEKKRIIQKRDAIIRNKNSHIEQLLQVERDFENVKNSKFGRIMYGWWGLKEKLIPQGSKRRFFAKLLKKFLRHPIYMLKKCTPSRIKRTLHYMRTENLESIENRLEAATLHAGEPVEKAVLDLIPLNESICSIDDVEKLILPKSEYPVVSIIIPVYNQIHYTYNCLKSIIQNTESVSYEVIIGDDCSTDLTREIAQFVENIIVSKTKENVRFLRNCNQAAQLAKGKYILFLNNDTQVQKEWLSSLVDLIESDEQIGMVGSKLLYPDGTLQEAGGIIWGNGNAWNYGNGQSPNKPEFNYVKEVDYISGASIMIRADLWNEIGGFDELFAPAYCEDSDLAFEIRKRGYKVMYQPKSVVVHFEGKSNGTDLSSGVKKYQIENSAKLKKKWVAEYKNQSPAEHDVFHARERSQGKPTILVIDHYVPQFDKDAGSKTTWQYLKMFVKQGYNVKFMGDNFYQDNEYTPLLEQMGIEVLYGPWYERNYKKWIIENQHNIDFVYLNRPHITEKYIDFIKQETNIKIIYYGHDLHFLRIKREYELYHDEKLLKESQEWYEKEIAIMRKADMNYYPSNVEVDEIHKMDSVIPAKAITAYVYEQFRENLNLDFSKREGIVFVGGFGHPPNEDAVLWFANEIYPIIREKQNIPFYIVGSKVTEKVKKLHGNGIIVKGFVTEEELMHLYDTCKIVVVPLRYGAGVKGKVVEALYYGTPMVSTTTGIEGIQGAESFMEVTDDAKEFADKVMSLYNDNDRLIATVEQYQNYVKAHYSTEAVWDIIKEDFSREGKR